MFSFTTILASLVIQTVIFFFFLIYVLRMVVQSTRRAEREGRINIMFIIPFPSACFSLLCYSFLSHTPLNPCLHLFVMQLLSTLRLLLLLRFCFSNFIGVLFFHFLLNLDVLSAQSASTTVLYHISLHNYVQYITTTLGRVAQPV